MQANPQITIDAKVSIVLQEQELRALAALSAYGSEEILMSIEKGVSKDLIHRHGDALRIFFDSTRSQLPVLVNGIDKARKHFQGESRV